MNGDLQQLMEHISAQHNEQMKAINEIGKQFAEHKGNITARVKIIEEQQKTQDNRQWVHSGVVLLLNTLHHTLGTHFGWKL